MLEQYHFAPFSIPHSPRRCSDPPPLGMDDSQEPIDYPERMQSLKRIDALELKESSVQRLHTDMKLGELHSPIYD